MRRELRTICGFAARKSPLNVINCVRITKSHCYATDITSSMKIAIDGPDMDACVDATLLADVLKGFPDGVEVSIEPGSGHIHVKGGKRRIKLRTVAPDGMPEIEAGGEFMTLDPATVSRALRFALPGAAVRDVARPMLTNVVIDFSAAGVHAVGCDGFRAHVFKISGEPSAVPLLCAIPRPLAQRLASLCEVGGTLKINRNRVIYEKGDAVFVAGLSGSAYPDWRRITPKPEQFETSLAVGRERILSAVESANRLGAVALLLGSFGGALSLSADLKGDEFADELEADTTGAGSMLVSPALLSQALAAMDDEIVHLHLPSNDRPQLASLIRGAGDGFCFVMRRVG